MIVKPTLRDQYSAFRTEFWRDLWDRTYAWEWAESNEGELRAKETLEALELIDRAETVQSTDPTAALELYRTASDAGSVWAMEMVAWHYHTGCACDVDFETAQTYYRRAIEAESWLATLGYAKLLDEHRYHDHCDRLLGDCVDLKFASAAFWLAYLRSRRRGEHPKIYREVAPLLEFAAAAGHPMAQNKLVNWKLRGKLGVWGFIRGMPFIIRTLARVAFEPPRGKSPD